MNNACVLMWVLLPNCDSMASRVGEGRAPGVGARCVGEPGGEADQVEGRRRGQLLAMARRRTRHPAAYYRPCSDRTTTFGVRCGVRKCPLLRYSVTSP